MPKVLLTGVIGPHGNISFDLTGDRLTRDQDIFTIKSHSHFMALHFIAQNIASPCTVLEHPTVEDLENELSKGYDFVGINFTLVNIPKTIEMCETIKKVAPNTKIVLGGYGTSCFTTIFKGNQEILKIADYVCHGEGVSFMRKLLGEPVDAPVNQAVGPRGASSIPWLNPFPQGAGGSVISGLGCPNMCEFCCTSHYYGGEFIEMANAEQLFDGMKRICRLQPDSSQSVAIFDENLYKDKDKVTRLGRLIREDKEFGLGKINYFSFGTIEDLSRYNVVDDLVLNGVGTIWIGVESLFSTLQKRQGRDVKEVFDDLHEHGINTVGSWIGGWDFHDKENIQEDLEYFISLKPTRTQLFPLYPPPGTSLYERLLSEGRLPDISLAKTYFGRTSGSQFGFPDWKNNFTEEEIAATVDSGNRRLYEYAGPSVMRELRVHLNGYDYCIDSPYEVLAEQRSELHEAHCHNAYPLIKVCEFFAPNEKVRKEIQEIRQDYHRLFGEPTIKQEVMSNYAFLKGCVAKMTGVIGNRPPSEEAFKRYEYDRKPEGSIQLPYTVSYPHKDERYEYEKGAYGNEMKLMNRVIEILEQGKPLDEAEESVREVNQVFENLEAIGNLSKLVEKTGSSVGLSESWLRTEVLKSLKTDESIC